MKRVYFRDAPIGAILRTKCGQVYRKRSSRTLEMAPGHSHYSAEVTRWFYALGGEVFDMEERKV